MNFKTEHIFLFDCRLMNYNYSVQIQNECILIKDSLTLYSSQIQNDNNMRVKKIY